MPQPLPWVSATTPSTFGNAAKADGLVVREKWSAMARATVAEQFTLDADVVARGDPPICPHMAHEFRMQQRRSRFDIGAKRIVAGEVAFVVAQIQVVHMDMFSRCNRLAGKANDLVIAAHRFARGNRSGGDFVPRWNQAAYRDVFNGGAAHQLLAGDDNIVIGVKSDMLVHGSGWCNLRLSPSNGVTKEK